MPFIKVNIMELNSGRGNIEVLRRNLRRAIARVEFLKG
jgi:hypothetical protein